MRKSETHIRHTQHALLVVWGCFAQVIGLVNRMEDVQLKQKTYWHSPQAKVLEFLVAQLAGLQHLQDISLAAHPLDMDQAVAVAWGQKGWADYSGISRTLSQLSWAEVHQLVETLHEVGRPFLQDEIERVLAQSERLWFDGDLTGLAVSNTSRSYPGAAFGHMDDAIRLGYQAAVVSLESPTYRRLWLSIAHHPGNTVSCSQAEALVQAAEMRTGLRPMRRTELFCQRIQSVQAYLNGVEQRLHAQQAAVEKAQLRLVAMGDRLVNDQLLLRQLEDEYQIRQRPERPTSQLAQVRKRCAVAQQKMLAREQALQTAQARVAKTQLRWEEMQAELKALQARLSQLEQDNATNARPVTAGFRLDAGFGTYENVMWLIEMGYEVYTKPNSHQVMRSLQRRVGDQTRWIRVGANAEMMAWSNHLLKGCAYPLDVALERFYTGKTLKHSALLHYGDDAVTNDDEALIAWFNRYNGRQLIEAGIKESKQVFQLHHIKVRTEPAIYLQEALVIFAANFIRWATHWLADRTVISHQTLDISTLGIKRQVQVAAHTSAEVVRNSDCWLLRFTPCSVFAGKELILPFQNTSRPLANTKIKSLLSMLFSMKSHLIAQLLG